MTRPGEPSPVIRAVEPDEVGAFLTVLGRANDREVDQRYVAAWDGAFDHERNVAAFEDGRLVGTATAGLVQLTLPGPVQVAAVCTGNLAVSEDCRTPGLAWRLFVDQMCQHRAAGFGALVFSVTGGMAPVHRRGGSAPATTSAHLTLTPTGDLVDGPPDVAQVDVSDPELYDLHSRVAAGTPGMLVRERSWMTTVRRISRADRPLTATAHADGASGRLDGYAIWLPDGGRLVVEELVAETPEACHALVADLLASGRPVELRHWRLDDPLDWWPGRPPKHQWGPAREAMWIRIVDVPRALAARRYAAAGAVTLEVTDRFLPDAAGRFTLEVADDGSAFCAVAPETRPADAALPIGGLAALYLGGTDVDELLAANVVRPRSSEAADRLREVFAIGRPPWSGSEH